MEEKRGNIILYDDNDMDNLDEICKKIVEECKPKKNVDYLKKLSKLVNSEEL